MPKGYAYEGGPLPYDEQGRGHRHVGRHFSQGTNEDILSQHRTDGNIAGYLGLYADGGDDIADQPPLGDLGQPEFHKHAQGLDEAFSSFAREFGPEVASQVFDDLLRVRAQQDLHGQRQPPQMNLPPAPGVPRSQPQTSPSNAFQRALSHR